MLYSNYSKRMKLVLESPKSFFSCKISAYVLLHLLSFKSGYILYSVVVFSANKIVGGGDTLTKAR